MAPPDPAVPPHVPHKRRRLITQQSAALAISLIALVATAINIKVAHDDRGRDTRYSIRAQVRNVSAGERLFGLTTNVAPDETLEFRARLHNWGNVDAADVTLGVDVPNASSGSLVKGSCRVTYPDQRRRLCDDRMDERHLLLASLHPNDTIEVRFRFKARLPSCNGYKASGTFTARSADRAALADTAVGYVARLGDRLDCDSDDATLMELIPLKYRDKCRLSRYDPVVGDALAHIVCDRPGDGIDELGLHLYENETDAKATYYRRLRNIGKAPRQKCAGDADGEGYQSYSGRSRQEIRYVCWVQSDGSAWMETVNRRYKLYTFAHRSDGELVSLFKWVNENTP